MTTADELLDMKLQSHERCIAHYRAKRGAFPCDKCGKVLSSERYLQRHQGPEGACRPHEPRKSKHRSYGGWESHQCKGCDGLFSSVQNLRRHVKDVCQGRQLRTDERYARKVAWAEQEAHDLSLLLAREAERKALRDKLYGT